MTRIAVFSDTHADARALQSILDAAGRAGISRFWCLGDFCSGGPEPAACYEMVMDACEAVALGNHELFVLSGLWRRTHAPWAVAAYDAAQELGDARIRGLLTGAALEVELPEAHLVHGSLTDRDRVNTFLLGARVAQANLALLRAPLLTFGHTHRPACWQPHKAGRWAREERIVVGERHDLPSPGRVYGQRLLNPGAGCDKQGARWMELCLDEDGVRYAVWHQTDTPGHGGVYSQTP